MFLTLRNRSFSCKEAEVSEGNTSEKVSLIVLSGDMDKVMGAFIIANGAAGPTGSDHRSSISAASADRCSRR